MHVDSKDNLPETSSIEHRSLDISAVWWAILLAVLWGGTSVSAKYSLETMGPFTVSCLRFVFGSIFVGCWCAWERESLGVSKRQLVPILILGIMLFFQIGLFTLGVKYSLASHGSLIINTYIFCVAAIEHFVTGTLRMKIGQLLGMILAFFGVCLILLDRGNLADETASKGYSILIGDLLLFCSAMLLGVKVIYTKTAMKRVTPGKLIFWHNMIGVLLFAVVALFFETLRPSDFTVPATAGLLYQGMVVAGFCFVMHAVLLKKHSASQLSAFSFASPVFGVVFAVVLLNESATIWILLSGIAVAVGIYLVNFTRRFRTADRQEIE